MPNLQLLVPTENVTQVKHLIEQEGLGLVLRRSVAKALGDVVAAQVAVYVIEMAVVENGSPMQIQCLASDSEDRRPKLESLALSISEAWQAFALEHSIEWRDDVDIWPIMPQGKWLMANPAGIKGLRKKLGL